MAGRGAPKNPAVKKTKGVAKARVSPKKAAPKKAAPKKTAPKKIASKKVSVARKPAPKKKVASTELATKSSTTQSEARKTQRSPAMPQEAPAPTPSERVLAACAELPMERALTDEERDAMAKIAETARRFVGAGGEPRAIVGAIAVFLDEVRLGRRDEPRSQDVRLGLGVLWGEQLRAQVGWRWVHLTYPDGFASYALVPDDRAFACFPLNRLPEALRSTATNTSVHVFDSIRAGRVPHRKPNAYLVIG